MLALSLALPAQLGGPVACCLAAEDGAAAVADSPAAGFVAGEQRPEGDGPAIKVPGGWMVAYDETIPGTDVTFRMIPVPGGTLRMGSPAAEADRGADEGPQYDVAIEPFWIGRCEVTWAEYKSYMAACDLFKAMESAGLRRVTADNESDAVTAPSNLYDPTTTFTNGEDPAQPAVTMTQFAARQYTKWLSGLTSRFYRLPLESEWEYACRAGTTTPWSSGSEADTLDAVSWFADNSDETTHPVGEKEPNAWGLHDMHGNVGEWVLDQLAPEGYARQAALPQPVPEATAAVWPTSLSPRVVRGGSYYDEPAQSIPIFPRARGGIPKSRPLVWGCGSCGRSPCPTSPPAAAGAMPTLTASAPTRPTVSCRAGGRGASSIQNCPLISRPKALRTDEVNRWCYVH
jgi:formylglycine-generating enzyme required for sulfatase activity